VHGCDGCIVPVFHVAVCARCAEHFRVTINVTSTSYEVELANSSSEEFRELADAVRADIEHVYRHTAGLQSANVLQFRSVTLAATSSTTVRLICDDCKRKITENCNSVE